MDITQQLHTTARRTPRLLSADDVAAALSIPRSAVRRLAAEGRIERIDLGYRTARYTVESVEALVNPGAGEEITVT